MFFVYSTVQYVLRTTNKQELGSTEACSNRYFALMMLILRVYLLSLIFLQQGIIIDSKEADAIHKGHFAQ